jgi:phosphoenolpyruvate carboxykinase (ATP)
LNYPTSLNGVDSKILNPRETWRNKEEYSMYANKVAEMFNQNFERFADEASEDVKRGAPSFD